MKEVKPDSWHWKLVKSYYPNLSGSISLCKYFWIAVWSLVCRAAQFPLNSQIWPVTYGVLITLFFVLPVYTAWAIGYNIPGTLPWFLRLMLILGGIEIFILMLVGYVLGAMSILLVAGFVCTMVLNYVFGPTYEKISKTDTYKLVSAYLKAKKDKVCPMLKLPQ